jgi:hypothetical protein
MSTLFYFMALDELVPPVPIDLDRRRHLRLGKRAVFRAEKALCEFWGKRQNILTMLFDPAGLTLNDIAILLWQGLLHEDPTLTLEQAQDMVTMANVSTIVTALYQSWNDATQDAGESTEGLNGTDPLAMPSPGVSSGVTPVSSLA